MPEYTGPVLGPSAHADTFCRDNLPPPEQWPEFVFDLPGLSYPARLNAAAELLDATAERLGAGRRCLLAPGGTSWSYGELRAITDQIARVLTDRLGVVPGNRVLLRGPNNPWLAACWLAVLKTGAVAVPTMPLLRASELTAIASIAQPMLAICDARFTDDLRAADLLDATAERLGAGRRCLLTPGGTSWSYGELRAVTDQIARVLTDRLGVVPGNRVLLRGPNNPWLAA
ncbi:MAG TPA: AMP-binding protein, partial [Streptosporangiaceae bacterium]|nr:AMP-binding protein [Streptosporangiaceae bacterium]